MLSTQTAQLKADSKVKDKKLDLLGQAVLAADIKLKATQDTLKDTQAELHKLKEELNSQPGDGVQFNVGKIDTCLFSGDDFVENSPSPAKKKASPAKKTDNVEEQEEEDEDEEEQDQEQEPEETEAPTAVDVDLSSFFRPDSLAPTAVVYGAQHPPRTATPKQQQRGLGEVGSSVKRKALRLLNNRK